MADNDLAQAYSILGESMGSSYRTRRKEEKDYRDDARRDARKDKLISYIAAPILQGAGKALATGATDLIGNLVLGENGKDFFNTEQGRIAARRSRYADNQEKILLKARSQLTQGGLDETAGQLNLLKEGYLAKIKLEYGDSAEKASMRNIAMRQAMPDLEKEAARLVEERDSLITYASKSPDMDVLKERLKSQDSFYGRTKGQRIMSTLVSKFTGRKPAEQGASYILTGSTDPTEAQRILRDNLMSDTYVEDFAKKLANLGDGRRNAYESAFTEFAAANPDLVRSMREGEKRKTKEYIKQLDYAREVETDINRFATLDPARAAWIGKNADNYKSSVVMQSAYFHKIGGFSDAAATVETDMYMNSNINQDTVKQLTEAVAFSRTNLTGDVIKDLEKFQATKQYNDVVKETGQLINNVFIPSFNKDLSLAMSKMSLEEKENLIGSMGAKEELLRRYLDFQIKNNLATDKTIFTKRSWLSNVMSEENVALLEDPEAGLRFILGQDPKNVRATAKVNGIYKRAVGKTVTNTDNEEVAPFYIMIKDKTRSKFDYIEEMKGSKEAVTKEVEDGLLMLKESLIKRAVNRNSVNEDGEGVLSAETVTDYEEFSSSLRARIDVKFPEEPTTVTEDSTQSIEGTSFATPVTAFQADKKAALARGRRNQQRRDNIVGTLSDLITRGGDSFGVQKGKQFGSPKEQASSLLSGPANPNPGFRSSKRSPRT